MRNINLLPKAILLITLLSTPLVSQARALAEEVSLADDGYHYSEFDDDEHDESYIEWWYFNFYDEANDIKGVFTYGIADPEDLSGFGTANVIAVIFAPEGIFQENDNYPVSAFSAYDEVNVEIISNSIENSIEALNDTTYHIVGASGNGNISWDLFYERKENPWFAYDGAPVGLFFPWMNMSWLLYMPGAEVEGTVTIKTSHGTKTYYISEAKGYHDHNWGEWIPAGPMWNWAQYYEPGSWDNNRLILDIGDVYNRNVGGIRVEYNGDATIFEKDQYVIFRSQWQYDSVNQTSYPGKLTIFAFNGDEDKLLLVTIESIEVAPIYKEAPKPFPNGIIYEQTAHFSGKLYEKKRYGWSKLVSFNGSGFTEYTVRDWVR